MPWFVTLKMREPTIITSMMASVVLNLHGLLTGLLQLFLRTNTTTTSFKPKGTPGFDNGPREIRFWGRNELGFVGHMMEPVSGPRSPWTIGSNSRASLVGSEKGRTSLYSMRSPPFFKSKMPMDSFAGKGFEQQGKLAILPEPVTSPSRGHTRKQSYSLFPAEAGLISPQSNQVSSPANWNNPACLVNDTTVGLFDSSKSRQAAQSTYTDNDFLAPPPSIHFNGGSGHHRRESSMESSATVQIGLRLSNVLMEPEPPMPVSFKNQSLSPMLQVRTQNLHNTESSPLQRNAVGSPISRDARMKTLPPVPRVSTMSNVESTTQLSPKVYSPQNSNKAGASLPPRPPQTKQERPRASKADWI